MREGCVKFYVYVMFHPIDGRPVYVGKGNGRRWSSKDRAHNPRLANIIGKYGSLPVVKVRERLSEVEAFAIEASFIEAIGRAPHRGPLVNLTDGGGGVSGYAYTDEARAKMSAAKKGRKLSLEHRAKISAAALGRKNALEAIAKSSAARRGAKRSAETIAKLSALARNRSADHIAKYLASRASNRAARIQAEAGKA